LIESRTTRRFLEAYANLPQKSGSRRGRPTFFFRENPRHPSLRFKKVDEQSNTWPVRVGLGYRALGVMDGPTVVWFWIGSHADYDRLL